MQQRLARTSLAAAGLATATLAASVGVGSAAIALPTPPSQVQIISKAPDGTHWYIPDDTWAVRSGTLEEARANAGRWTYDITTRLLTKGNDCLQATTQNADQSSLVQGRASLIDCSMFRWTSDGQLVATERPSFRISGVVNKSFVMTNEMPWQEQDGIRGEANGGVTGASSPPVTLERAGRTTVYSTMKWTTWTGYTRGSIEFTAPEGTTFAAGQESVMANVKPTGSDTWSDDTANGALKKGRYSDDGTTLRYEFTAVGDDAFTFDEGTELRWPLRVDTSRTAPAGEDSLVYSSDGSSTHGDFRIEGETPTSIEVEYPTGEVTFTSADVSEHATASGTGADGATITLFKGDSDVVLGTTIVEDGRWSKQIPPTGAGIQEIRVEQTGVNGTQVVTISADFGSAVAITAPATFADGKVTITGQSSQGAEVAIVTGSKTVATFTVTNPDGTFSHELNGVGSGTVSLTATAKSKGALITTDTVEATAVITAESIALASHVKDGTFDPGQQLFTGRGTVGATITLNPFGFEDRYRYADLTTTVDQFGTWSIQRNLANTAYTLFAVKQTPQTGVTNELPHWNLKPVSDVGEPGDLSLSNFKAGDFFNPGDQIFAGKATPGATVTLNPFGLDPRHAEHDLVTTADAVTGKWQIRCDLEETVYPDLAVKQASAAEGRLDRIEDIVVAAASWTGTPADLVLTSHQDGTFTPGDQTFTGTATPGTEVTLYVWGVNPTNPASTTTDARGTWTIKRILAEQPYPARFVQADPGEGVAEITHPLTPAE